MAETAEDRVECRPFRAQLSLRACRANQEGRKKDDWYPCGTCEAGRLARELMPEAPGSPGKKPNWTSASFRSPARATAPPPPAAKPIDQSLDPSTDRSMSGESVLTLKEAFCPKHPEERQVVVQAGPRKGRLLGKCRLCFQEMGAKNLPKKKEAPAGEPDWKMGLTEIESRRRVAEAGAPKEVLPLIPGLLKILEEMKALGIKVSVTVTLGGEAERMTPAKVGQGAPPERVAPAGESEIPVAKSAPVLEQIPPDPPLSKGGEDKRTTGGTPVLPRDACATKKIKWPERLKNATASVRAAYRANR